MMDNEGRPIFKIVKRVVFKEIVEGDFRKFEAQSNDADTGGGARDLRFRPYAEFERIFRKLFPDVRREKRKRDGVMAEVEILVGRFYWTNSDGQEVGKEATFEPPTDARQGEGRIPIVHTYPPFNKVTPPTIGRTILLLIQQEDDKVYPAFTTEESLRLGEWSTEVAGRILESLNATRPANQVARGYIDFESDEMYSDV